MNRKTLLWLGLGIVAACAITAIGLLLYGPARPHLIQPERPARMQKLKQYLSVSPYSEEKPDTRSAIGAWREFLLDYPEATDPDLQLKFAQYASGGQSPDFQFVADQVEQAVLAILARYGPDQSPTTRDLIAHGLPDEKQYRDWTNVLFVEDVDGDGRQDVVLIAPGLWGESICFLFRHTLQGWKPHRLVVGAHIMGIWIFDVTKTGPKVIEVASLADSAYKPNLFVDVFAWQKGRVRSVLSNMIPNGFQLDHKDVDGKGIQAIRFYGNESAPADFEWPYKSHLTQTYRWNGEKYTLTQTAAVSHQDAPWLEVGKRLFEAGEFQKAVATLKSGLAKPRQGDNDYEYEYRQEPGHYYLGMSYAMMGQFNEALEAMSQILKQQQGNDAWYEYAQKFRSACQHPGDLPVALASIGQGFRVLEQAGHKAPPNATAKQVIDSSGIPVDSWREVLLNGQSGGVARIHWFGGSAVVVILHDPAKNEWAIWPIAYALESPLPKTNWYPESQELLYLPHPPVNPLYPVPTTVALADVSSGTAPKITVRYNQAQTDKESIVQWNGDRFAVVGPLPAAKEDFVAELNRLESALSHNRDYSGSLDVLTAFERRLRASELTEQDKSNLLLEVFYHQALCYRKLGQNDRAAVMYAALSRGDAQNAWTTLAKQWVRFDAKSDH